MLSVYSWKKSINNVDIMLLLYWWILPQVFEAMFRVIKESEYVDERQHCFLIQVDLTQCGLKDIQKDLIENLIHSKRLNYSVCQANRHLICRVYVPSMSPLVLGKECTPTSLLAGPWVEWEQQLSPGLPHHLSQPPSLGKTIAILQKT